MKFEELQRQWHEAKYEPMSHEDWKKMMYAPRAPWFRQITGKELLIFLRTVFFFSLVVYLFDGLKTWPGWILTAYWAYIFLDEYFGLRYMEFTPYRETLQKSLTEVLTRVRHGALVSKIIHGILWALVVFALGATQTGSMNTGSWALILLPVLLAVGWWSGRKWSRKITEVRELLREFSEDSTFPEPEAV